MLSFTDYLLTKLNEECIELADIAIQMQDKGINNKTINSELFGEVNDTLAVIDMLAGANITPSDLGSNYQTIREQIEGDATQSILNKPMPMSKLYTLLPQQISLQALRVAKMATKCMVFGLNEVYVGQTLHNTERLYIEVVKLQALVSALVDLLPDIKVCKKAQQAKRAKMLKFMPISVEQGAVDSECANKFQALVDIMDS